MRILVFVTIILSLSGCAVSASAAQWSQRVGVSLTASRICNGCDTPRLNNLAGPRSSAAIIGEYYRSINARAFRRAYSYIVPTGRPPFASWKAGYRDLRYVELRQLASATYLVRRTQGTFTCVGARIIAVNKSGALVSYGGFYVLERSQGRWKMDLPGSRIRQGGQAIVPSRAACKSAIPGVSSGTPKEILDVSFVDSSHGWLLGLSCAAEQSCYGLTIAVTSNGGSTWSQRSSIRAGLGYTMTPQCAQPAANRARSIRFADRQNGWVYGPALYATHDGGRNWTSIPVNGVISDVIPVGHSVWAVETRCRGNKCSTMLIASGASSNAWRPLPHQPVQRGGPLQLDRVDASHSWLLYRPGDFTTLPRLISTANGGATWFSLPFPCSREFDFAARMAASNDHNLYLVCASQPAAGQQFKEVSHSTDGGRRWSPVSSSGNGFNNLTASGYLSDLAVTGPETAFLALGRGTLMVTTNGGRVWRPAIPQGRDDPGGGGVGPLVFINSHDGWLVSFPYDLFRTTNGGRRWQQLLGQGQKPSP